MSKGGLGGLRTPWRGRGGFQTGCCQGEDTFGKSQVPLVQCHGSECGKRQGTSRGKRLRGARREPLLSSGFMT